jgi:alcohol dehydrogenase
VSIPTLLKMVASGRIPAEKMGTHSFTFAQMDEAYDVSRTPPRTPPSRW